MKKNMEKLRKLLCNELDEIAEQGELSAGDLETVHKLTDTVKNIDKIDMLEDDGYSQRYEHGNSYRRYSQHGKKQVVEKMEDLADSCTGQERDIICDCIDRIQRL